MSFERTSPFLHAPQTDESHESDNNFPADVHLVSLEGLVEGINATTAKFRRQVNLDVVAHDMHMRPVDILESFRRAERDDVLYVLESVSHGKQRFERYLERRAIIERLRREKQTYSIQDFAQELGISETAAKGHMRKLGDDAEKLFGFTPLSVKHPPEISKSNNIEERVRTAYTNAVIALYRKGIRHFTPAEIAENVQGLSVKITGGTVKSFLEHNPGFIEKIVAEEERR